MIEVRELTTIDGTDVFEMVQEIGTEENGFVNSMYADSFTLFQEKFLRNYEISKGIHLASQYVPQTIYWLYVDGKPVGYGELRHYLNHSLLQHGGHIGYVISQFYRGKGYAKMLLKEIIKQSKEKKNEQV